LPRRRDTASKAKPALPGRRAAGAAAGAGAGNSRSQGDAARDMLGQLMPMMNQLFADSDDESRDRDGGGDGASIEEIGGPAAGGGEVDDGLSSEERQAWQRWLPTVEEDVHEQEEMRLREPFSPAYKALNRYEF